METLSITFMDYGATHAFEVIAPLAAVLLLLNKKIRQSSAAMISSCILLILGVFAHRFLLMPAAFDKIQLSMNPLGLQHVYWSVPIASGRYDPFIDTFVTKWHYFPSAIETTIFLGVLAFMCFMVLFAVDRFPIVSEIES